MKGKTARIDKTARQKGAPSWLKELLYVDEVDDDDEKPTDKSDATGQGSVRDRELPKSNTERGLSRSLCKSFHRNLSILALMPSSHSSWLRTRAQPGWWHPSPHLEYSSFTRR